MVVTLLISQPPISWLNVLFPLNVLDALITCEVSMPVMSLALYDGSTNRLFSVVPFFTAGFVFPASSVNVPVFTSTAILVKGVATPAMGVTASVYVNASTCINGPAAAPFVIVISDSSKPTGSSLNVNVIVPVPPSPVIVTVGAVVSISIVSGSLAGPSLPASSVSV